MTQPQTSEASETMALDVVYAWLGGGRAARQSLTETRYRHLVQRIALALDGQRTDYERVADYLDDQAEQNDETMRESSPGARWRDRHSGLRDAYRVASSRVRQVGQQQ